MNVRGSIVFVSLLLASLTHVSVGQPSTQSANTSSRSCDRLKSLRLKNVQITGATLVMERTYPMSQPTVAGISTVIVPAHCEVRAIARPTTDSEIDIEVWLPVRDWNGRYEQLGNGGWAGAIHRSPLAGAVRSGYVAAATDDGHKGGIDDGGEGQRTAEFAIGHPEKLIDFGYRALHETRVTAAALIRAFYSRDALRSYFVGCSDGGREALMIAQRFPEDFDGILAGNPANDWSHWAAGLVWGEQAQISGTPGAIPIAKRALIQSAVLSACDDVDGVKDGLISDPRFCKFDPATLICSGPDLPECLTSAQVATLRKIYGGPRNPRTAEQIFPGYPPGIENVAGSNIISPVEQAPSSFGDLYFGQVVFERRDWDFRTLDFDKDIEHSNQKGSPILDSVNPDLRSFRAHGGKLIQYHGWSDPLIPAGSSIAYYERTRAFMESYPDARNDGSRSLDRFYRLFMIPGMGHCYGGVGPTSIMSTGAGRTDDPQTDLMLSLVRWVEDGIAPEKFIGTGKVPNDPSKIITRPICVYPRTARYKGTGSANDAANFECAAPPDKS